MTLSSIRFTNFLAFLICCILLGFGIYLEVVKGLQPCPLCILQRLVFIVLGIFFLIGSLVNFTIRWRRYYHLIIVLIAVIGIAIASRQVWLEHLPPDQVPACGANLRYLFQILPFHQALQMVFQGSGECAKVTWRLLGLSIPEWSLLFFTLLAVFGLWQAFRKKSKA